MRLCHCRGSSSLPFKVVATVSSSSCVFDPPAAGAAAAAAERDFTAGVVFSLFFF